jgi:hypothetical protein
LYEVRLVSCADIGDVKLGKHVIVGFGGFKYRVLFYRFGYSPHYAEHVIDPLDGREKLVLAIPHTTPNAGKVAIYDIENDVIEWKVNLAKLSDWIKPNPHVAHMIVDEDFMNPVTGSWAQVMDKIRASPGDIIAPAPDNTWVVIDRRTKSVKFKLKPVFVAKWVHDIVPSTSGDGLIVTDYGVGVFKVGFDGSIRWGPIIGGSSAKLSRVFHAIREGHEPGFGGDYIAVANRDTSGVYEVSNEGSITWFCGSNLGAINVFWPFTPHSAFRLGLAKRGGNLTVVGLEAGGGIVAIDKDCRPRWGIVKPYSLIPTWIYRPTSFGLMETTHVFPTLRGTIGFVDWSDRYGSTVGEVLEIPYHQTLWFTLAHDHDPGEEGTYYDPPLEVSEWREVKLIFINIGSNSLDYSIYVTNMPFLNPFDWPTHWKKLKDGKVNAGSIEEVDVSGYVAIRVFGKRAVPHAASQWKIIVVFKR